MIKIVMLGGEEKVLEDTCLQFKLEYWDMKSKVPLLTIIDGVTKEVHLETSTWLRIENVSLPNAELMLNDEEKTNN